MSGADRKASERKFYSRMALFLVFLVLLGFGPSFYLRNVVPAYPRPNPTLPPAVILHGTVFTLWMALIVAQTQLISARKHSVHMTLGKIGMPQEPLLLIPVETLPQCVAVRSQAVDGGTPADLRAPPSKPAPGLAQPAVRHLVPFHRGRFEVGMRSGNEAAP